MTLNRATFLATMLTPVAHSEPLASIEARYGGRIGVVAFEVGGDRRIAHRADERFPMASTWKLPLVMAVLGRVDAGRERLDRLLRFTAADLEPPYSTIAERYPRGGSLTIGEICRRTISQSDNTGADLLARTLGGPRAVWAYLQSIGVRGVRIDRLERDLPASANRAEVRDTATPSAMANLAARLAAGSPLSPESTALLLHWMRATTTGDRRLRARGPPGWHVADKTGSYDNVANDVGLLYPPSGRPIAIACYTADVHGTFGASRAIADAARAAVRSLVTAVVLVLLLLPSAAHAQPVTGAFAYDEIQRVADQAIALTAPGRYDEDDASLRAEIDQGTVVSGEALRTRLYAAQRREEAANKDREQRNPASRGSSFLGLLSSFLPPQVQAIGAVVNGGGIRALLGALPGVGGAIAGQVLSLIPSKSAGGTVSATEVRSLAEDAQRLSAAVAREELLGHLTHVTSLGTSYRIDDVAGALSVIVDRDGGRWITLDHLRHTARVEALADANPLRSVAARVPASTATEAAGPRGAVRLVHHVVDTGTSVHDGIALHGYVDTEDPQQGPAACGPSTSTVTRTIVLADIPALKRIEEEWANERGAAAGCPYVETFDGPQPPADRLPVYLLYAASDGFSILQERGHITRLNAGDAGKLFAIPGDYARE